MNQRTTKSVFGRLVESTKKRSLTSRRRGFGSDLNLQVLEDRRLMATLVWDGTLSAVDSHWNYQPGGAGTDSNWTNQLTSLPGLPASGDTLIFPSGAPGLDNFNNTGAASVYNLQFTGNGYTLHDNSIVVGPSGIVDNSSGGALFNTIALNVFVSGNNTINVSNSNEELFLNLGISSGPGGSINKTGSGFLSSFGAIQPNINNTVTAGTLDLISSTAGSVLVNGGTLELNNGNVGQVSLNGGTLIGVGSASSITSLAGGIISPGFSPGTINTGTITLNAATTYKVELAGNAVNDQLNVSGNVTLAGANLNLSLLYAPAAGDSYTIVNNDGTDPINGTFTYLGANLPNSSIITLAGSRFVIRYDGGTGNDVVITAIGPPIANPDVYALPETTNNTAFVTPFGTGVLANDTGTNLQAVLEPGTGPTHGTLVLNGDGTFSYTPTANFFGTDSFMYRAVDTNLQSLPVIVTLNVNAVNEAPVTLPDDYTLLENSAPFTVIAAAGVLVNDHSPDALPITVQLPVVVNPAHGTLAIAADGSFTYTPFTNYFGPDSFVYRAIDSNGLTSNMTLVTLTVTQVIQAPTAVNDGTALAPFTTNENTTLTVAAPGVLGNDTDPQGNVLTASLFTGPTHGSVTLNADGSFVYIPVTNYSGPDSFTYRTFNGSLFSATAATVFLGVRPVNQPPVAVDDVAYVPEDSSVIVPVLNNDSDPENSPLTAVLVNAPLHGTVVLNAGNTSFTYTPNALYNGADFFTYRAFDGSLSSNIARVDLTVGPINHPPVAVADAFSVNENATLTVSGPGVLGNDTDPDNNVLQAFVVNAPTHGSLTLNSNGSFVYVPVLNYRGADSFTYRVYDGTTFGAVLGTVSLTVLPVNQAPVARDDVYTLPQDTVSFTMNVLANDTDVDSPALTVILVTQPQHGTAVLNGTGTAVLYTPFANYRGTDFFTYRASDGLLTSDIANVAITVTPINHAPVAVNDVYSVNEDKVLTVSGPGVLANDTDIDANTTLSAFVIGQPMNGALVLNSNGSFVYTPDPNFNGTDTFTYQVSDGQLISNIATVTITVRLVNDAPVAAPDFYSTTRAATLSIPAPGILGNDTDADLGTVITAQLVQPTQHGSLVLNANGSFVYTPVTNFVGIDTFTYRASDGMLTSAVTTVTITVTEIAATTIVLDPASDTGISNTDHITKDNTPVYFGTAPSLLTVKLFAVPQGSMAAPTLVGTTTSDIAGHWSIKTSTLPDGVYDITTASYYADGVTTGPVVSGGSITIDTVAPIVIASTLNVRTGQISVTYLDDRSGLEQGSIGNPLNYNFGVVHIHAAAPVLIRGVRALPAAPNGPRTVLLDVSGGSKLQSRTYVFGILSGGVQDIAGNALSGNFAGGFPSGQGSNTASDFKAQFNPTSQIFANAVPTSYPVFITPPGTTKGVNVGLIGKQKPSKVAHAPVGTPASSSKTGIASHTTNAVPKGPATVTAKVASRKPVK